MKCRTLIGSLLTLAACSQPIRRDSPVVSSAAAGHGPIDRPTYDGVRKRVWVLPFKLIEAKPDLKIAKDVNLPEDLQKSLQSEISKPNSPFVSDTADETDLLETRLDSSAPIEQILKIAHNSTSSGFIRGDIREFTIDIKEAPEGILRSSTLTMRVTVDFELYDAGSSRKLYGGTAYETLSETRSPMYSSESEDAAKDLHKKLVQISDALAEKIFSKIDLMADKLGWQGRILRVDGPRIFINAGRRTGLQVGDTMKVIDRSKEIYDPQTGLKLGDAPGRLKATLRITQEFGLDGSIAVLISGGGVGVNDRVELNQ